MVAVSGLTGPVVVAGRLVVVQHSSWAGVQVLVAESLQG